MPHEPQHAAWSETQAVARIEAARRDNATALDLSGLCLRTVPEAVRDLPDLRELRLNDNCLREVPGVIRSLPGLTLLDLSQNRLLELPGWLAGLEDLTWFDLSDNQVVDVPAWLGERSRLTHLGLCGCDLADVPAWTANLTALAELWLDDNWLTTIPEWLGDLTELTDLRLSSNQFRALPESLGRLASLTRMDIDGCRLTELPRWIAGLSRLTHLDCGFNQLTNIPDSLGELTALANLDLSGSRLTAVPGWLRNLTKLSGLRLARNHLTEIPEWLGTLTGLTELGVRENLLDTLPATLGQLTGLRVLYLNGNRLTRVPDWLSTLCRLTRLALGGNRLPGLPSWLGDLSEVSYLNLYDCGLSAVPDWIARLTKLSELRLHNNNLIEVPEWLGELTELRTLRLENNRLRSLPRSLAGLGKLTALNVENNRLAELPAWIGELDGLISLKAGGNKFTALPASLDRLADLQVLSLARSGMTEWPAWIADLAGLTILNLRGNQLGDAPPWLGDLTRLTELDLAETQLARVPDAVQRLARLGKINLTSNTIGVIPDWLAELSRLHSLYLSKNKLAELPPALARLTLLQSLNLSGNQLSSLPDWLAAIQDMHYLAIGYNPLSGLPEWLGQLTRIYELSISGCGLSEVPGWIANLEMLQILDIADNHISSLPTALSKLTELECLLLANNRLKDLPAHLEGLGSLVILYADGNELGLVPECIRQLTGLNSVSLTCNQIDEIPEWLGSLTGLTFLNLTQNRITRLPETLSNLTRLTWLYLNENDLTEIPDWIGSLRHLRRLDLEGNSLTAIPPTIGHLDQLRTLDLRGNKISAIPQDLAELRSLESLTITGNQLTDVPDWLLDLPGLDELLLADNPLLSPPPEIAASGTESVLAFLRARRAGSSRQWVSKLLVVGEGGVGKTSLIKALLGAEHDPAEETTHGIRVTELPVRHPGQAHAPHPGFGDHTQVSDLTLQHQDQPGIQMRLTTWDFGGQEIYHATHQFFLTDRSLFLLLWNTRLGWEQGKLEYWLDIIKSRAPESPVLLVATHADASQRPVDLPLDDLKREYPQVVGNLIVDNATRRGIDELRAELARRAAGLPLMGAEWPTTWVSAADAVKASAENHITPDQMWRRMADAGVTDPEQQKYLAVAMHQLGDILYYDGDPELEQTVVLRPEWVNEYISDVLDSKAVDQARGLLTHDEMTRLWARLDRGMRDHFLGMMDKYEISFRVDGRTSGVVSLVVERLPWNPPPFGAEWEQLAAAPGTSQIRVRYQLNTTPPGIPTWFIARSHRFTTNTHWRTGALLAHPDGLHKALVRAQARRNTVELTVRGPAPAAFFSVLDDGFNQTLLRYPGLEIRRLVPCPCGQVEGTECSELFDYDDLQKRLQRTPPRHEIECHRSGEMMNIPALLLGIAPSEREPARVAIERLTTLVDGYGTMLAAKLVGVVGVAGGQGVQVGDGNVQVNLFTGGEPGGAEQPGAIAAGIAGQAEYLERMFLKLLRLTQDAQEVRCPSVFSVVPVAARVTGAQYEIRLYCEEPGAWHPLPGETGCYPVTEPAEWLRKIRPHLRQLLTVLKHVAPLAGPVLGMASGHVSDRITAELGAMTEIVDQVPEFSRADLPGRDGRPDQDPAERAASEADFRALESLLVKLDPERGWGGLSRTVTPEGLTLYLCRDHADAYRRAVRL